MFLPEESKQSTRLNRISSRTITTTTLGLIGVVVGTQLQFRAMAEFHFVILHVEVFLKSKKKKRSKKKKEDSETN
jgi:hypothetical protein